MDVDTLKKFVIDTIYPVGSTYTNVRDNRNPSEILGIGKWTIIEDGYYLRASSEGGGTTLNAGLPDIQGTVGDTPNINATGAFYKVPGSVYVGCNGGAATFSTLDFKASRYNAIYGASNTVQPKSLKVYIWERIE